MAVKKKSAAKKAAPKKKSTAKKSVAKKSVAKKKSTARKTVKKTAKKTVAKKAVAKRVVKKSAKKAVAKRVVKKTAKKTVKKSAAKKSSTSKVVIPPVPTTGANRINVSTTPAKAPAARTTAAKPSAAPRQGSSGKTLLAVLVGVLILGAIVITKSGSNSDDAAPVAEPSVSESAMEQTPEPATDMQAAPTTGQAPTRFIGNWKDSSKSVMVITWKAPAGDVKGYKVETRSGSGAWNVVSEVSATTFSSEFAKKSEDGSTSFQVSAVYADGSLGVAKAFGFAGQFE